MDDEDIIEQWEKIRVLKEISRRARYRRSRLDKYRSDIEVLNIAGASWRDIAIWLKQEHRLTVHPTTVGRAMARWKEHQGNES